MIEYNPKKIESKWQKEWERKDFFQAINPILGKKTPGAKFYVLVEFPYPSGSGLHVGHCRSYIGLDILSRKKRMEGFNVLFPMGWDAFGLPTENYAIKTGIHPAVATERNTNNFRKQEKSLGLSFDWSREVNTTDPEYYKWTQWIFIQLFKNGLAYKAKMPINWCPSCKIGLANEEVVNDGCERCGEKVIRKEKEQWLLGITKYAERLINDLELVDYPERVKISQKEWIGRSEGIEVNFPIAGSKLSINVFTTRIDTVFGVTYLVLAPESPVIEKIKNQIENLKFVNDYIEKSKGKLERERISETKDKSGIKLKGVMAKNPVNGREIPIFIADYVLLNYGTGAVMAVPAHDQRDFDFAKKFNLPIIDVIKPMEIRPLPEEKAYEGEGIMINSGRFDGMKSEQAKDRIGEWLVKQNLAQKKVYYKLRDWVFSRQHYWGEPTPMVNCQKCGWVPVPEKDLPIELPKVKNFKPNEKGESPLIQAKKWINATCPKCGGPAQRETDVMPNWAGSNWYYLRYCDPRNDKVLADPELLKYWMPVDWYNGGMEHTTLHLLYSRFIYKFLWDIKAVPKEVGPEPYKKRTSHGVILGAGGIKMSKSKGNVINPDDVIKKYGADVTRIYQMFMGPFDQMIPWDEKGVVGIRRFLEKIWGLSVNLDFFQTKETSPDLKKLLHKTIKKVSEDINYLKFNTAVSSLMEFCNAWQSDREGLAKEELKDFLKILAVFAPFIAEEIWQQTQFEGSVHTQKWPEYDPRLIKEEKISLIIQINGKVRDKMEVETSISEEEAKEIILSREKVQKWLEGKEVKKVIFVPGKLINIVV